MKSANQDQFEKAGMILNEEENMIMRGFCKGSIPKGKTIAGVLFRPSIKPKIEWQNVEGKMVLTDSRLWRTFY